MTPVAGLDQVMPVLERMLSFDTTSSNSNLELLRYVDERCQEYGAPTEFIYDESGRKANLLVTVPAADGRTTGGVMFLGHTDTVPIEGQAWTHDPFSPTVHEGRIYARGAADMKAFCACAVAAIPVFAQAPLREPVHVVLTYDEETGCHGAKKMEEVLARRGLRPDLCVVGEPTSMSLVRSHKSGTITRAAFHGVASHSSLTNQGCNAIEYAARAIAFLRCIADEFRTEQEHDDSFTVPYTTVNVGTIQGGLAVNIVPESCEFEWEMRTVRAEHHREISARFDSFMNDLKIEMQSENVSARIDYEVLADFPGLAPTYAAQELIDAMGYISESTGVSYGTEAGLISDLGVPTIVCGPGSIEQAHRADEWVELAQVQQCFDSMLALRQYLVEPVASSVTRAEKVDLV